MSAALLGPYVLALPPGVFDRVPKSVWAALAISYIANRDQDGTGEPGAEEAWPILFAEWETLYAQGIVDQKPPRALAAAQGGAR